MPARQCRVSSAASAASCRLLSLARSAACARSASDRAAAPRVRKLLSCTRWRASSWVSAWCCACECCSSLQAARPAARADAGGIARESESGARAARRRERAALARARAPPLALLRLEIVRVRLGARRALVLLRLH